MADPLDQYGAGTADPLDLYRPRTSPSGQSLLETVGEPLERDLPAGRHGPSPEPRPGVALPHATLTGHPVRTSVPHVGAPREVAPSTRRTAELLGQAGVSPFMAESAATLAPWTIPGASYDAGTIVGAAAQERDPAMGALGAGMLATIPLGVRAPIASRMVQRPGPAPITGHTVGSLRLPTRRDVDPGTGLYSAAEEAAHSYPRAPSPASTTTPGREGIIGTASEVQRWMSSQGVTAAEMQHRNLNQLFADPRRTITRQELLQHLADNPVQLQTARYQGQPQYNVVRADDVDAEPVVMAGPFPDERAARAEMRAYAYGRDRNAYDIAEVPAPAGTAGPGRHPDWSLSGNTNPTYREDVLYAPPPSVPPGIPASAATGMPPPRSMFTDAHYPDQPNPIGWIRSSEERAYAMPPGGHSPDLTTPTEGILWDELQMPMAQRVRDQGARNEARIADLQAESARALAERERLHEEVVAWARQRGEYPPTDYQSDIPFLQRMSRADPHPGPPGSAADLLGRIQPLQSQLNLRSSELATALQAPPGNAFVNDPHQALRTLMHYGLADPRLQDRRFGGIFLTPGDMQIDRYNLGRYIDHATFIPRPQDGRPGAGYFMAGPRGSRTLDAQIRDRAHLNEFVGRDLADQLLAAPAREVRDAAGVTQQGHRLDGLQGTRIGGRGMLENYDRIYPDTLDAILRRLDPQYPGRRQVYLNSGAYADRARPASEVAPSYYSDPVHFFPLTDRIREQLARGLPYFAGAGAAAGTVLDQYSRPAVEE